MAQFNSDQDYLDAGVTPPEHVPHGLPGDNNEDLSSIIAAQGRHKHEWYIPPEHPGMIECAAGGHIHGHGYDHVNKRLIGTDGSGHPVFEDIVLADHRPEYQELLKQVDKNRRKTHHSAIGASRPNKNVG